VTADGFVPSSIGELLNSAWRKLDDRDDLTVHEFQVMPDHTHGTVELLGGYELGSLVRRLKSQVTRLAAPNAVRWQRSFYDRRIRTEGDLLNVCEYIRNNPAAWWAKFGG
jgi:REP element-mobilizing transposase RayT